MAGLLRPERLWRTVAVIAAFLWVPAVPLAAEDLPTAEVLGGFEVRLSWTDPEAGVPVILTLIIYPSNAGSIEGVLTCDQAASTSARSQTYTQRWGAGYDPTAVDLWVHAFWRCSGDWAADEPHPFHLEVYQLPGYATTASSSAPLLAVDGNAPVGEAMSGMRPAAAPVVRVNVTPADPAAPGTSSPDDGSPDAGGPGEASTGVEPGGTSGDEPPGEETVSSVPRPPGSVFGAQSADGDAGGKGGWSPLGITVLILFLILMALAAGRSLKASVASVLLSPFRSEKARPTPGETAALARDVQWGLGREQTVTVQSPVMPWSSPDPGAPRADFVLQPGQPYTMLGGRDGGPDDWVQVRQGENSGWVHRSTLQEWREEVVVMPRPPGPGDYRETVNFPQGLDTRDPGGTSYTRREAGNYQLGPPGPDGFRPVYDWQGRLIGGIPADKVPPSPLTRPGAPPPPPPPAL